MELFLILHLHGQFFSCQIFFGNADRKIFQVQVCVDKSSCFKADVLNKEAC